MSKTTTYTLTPEGAIPDFVIHGGQFPVANGGTPPQDWTLVGTVNDDAPGDAFTVATLSDYLIANGWSGERSAMEAAAIFMGDTATAGEEQAAREALKASVLAKLAALGLTEDEAAALVGA